MNRVTPWAIPTLTLARTGEVRNPPYPPLRAVEHLANRPQPFQAPEGGEAA